MNDLKFKSGDLVKLLHRTGCGIILSGRKSTVGWVWYKVFIFGAEDKFGVKDDTQAYFYEAYEEYLSIIP